MQKRFSTCILPENSEQLLFSIRSGTCLYHCWMNQKEQKFVVIKESNNLRLNIPNQLLNFSERELKRYLLLVTAQLKYMDEFLFFNEVLWDSCMA
jgi:hypothetical protein